MLSKQKIKYIHSLEQKKVRKEHHVFLAEGKKLIKDILHTFTCKSLFSTKEWLSEHKNVHAEEIIEVTNDELQKLSLLKTPKDVLAVFYQPDYDISEIDLNKQLVLALDGIQDPGNLGTIIRLADWFGIEHLICSLDTTDVYNPKTVQATMGALARVKVHYISLSEYLNQISQTPIYGTFLEGKSIYHQPLTSNGIIVLGNEGNGIRSAISPYVTKKIVIPNYPQGRQASESLNVATAAAIVCAEFRRHLNFK